MLLTSTTLQGSGADPTASERRVRHVEKRGGEDTKPDTPQELGEYVCTEFVLGNQV